MLTHILQTALCFGVDLAFGVSSGGPGEETITCFRYPEQSSGFTER